MRGIELSADFAGSKIENKSFSSKEIFSNANQSFYEKISEKGRDFVDSVYEGIHKIPLVNRVAAKLEIAYDNKLIDYHDAKASDHKFKLDNYSDIINSLEESKEDLYDGIKELKAMGISGSDSLLKKIDKIDKKIEKLSLKKEKYQNKFDASEEKKESFIEDRDAVADRMIAKYEEKLDPLQEKIDDLQSIYDETELDRSSLRIKHRAAKEELAEIDQIRLNIQRALKNINYSERKVNKEKSIKELKKVIAQTNSKMDAEKNALNKKLSGISKKIDKVLAKASPYKNRVKEFQNLKINKRFHTDSLAESKIDKIRTEQTVEKKVEKGPRFAVQDFILSWNTKITKKYGSDSRFLVNETDFSNETSFEMDFPIKKEEFVKTLKQYLRLKKVIKSA
jgi:DNA repair exonuclease SbcCD ATPase subunit